MSFLLDTSILVRAVEPESPLFDPTIRSIELLRSKGEELMVVPQNLVEFWAVATRPISANGLGLSTVETENQIAQVKLHFILRQENETIFENWAALVNQYQVIGKTTHDARIVAAMQSHGISDLLTFNVADFSRYIPSISVHSPHDILSKQ